MLARDLGMLVSDLRERMSHVEFMEWAALYEDEQGADTSTVDDEVIAAVRTVQKRRK